MTPELHVRVGRAQTITTHPLYAALYAGDDCVSQTVHFRDMRQVRSYYNGVLAGLTLTNSVYYGDTITLTAVGGYRHHRVSAIVPVNPHYDIAPSIDRMDDTLV